MIDFFENKGVHSHGNYIRTKISLACNYTTVYLESKAFDTLNNDIFFSKLEFYGISGIPLALLKSYLINRFQYVQYENMTSELLEIKTGITQGSILGPVFFSILINDLVNSSRLFFFSCMQTTQQFILILKNFRAII